MRLIEKDITFGYFRFYELKQKLDRNELIYQNFGYVNDADGFLTGCLCNLPNNFYFVLGKPYILIGGNCNKRFKTIIDFVENKITCQGLYYKDIDGYLQDRITNLTFDCNLILPSDNKDDLINYFKNNF
jgi:hypothetical protein